MVKKARIIACIGLIIYMFAGLMLFTDKKIHEVSYESNGALINLQINDELQIKFLGEDLYLYNVEIPTPDTEYLADADFFFGAPSSDLDLQYEDIPKDHITVTDSQINISIQPTKLVYGRDYYVKISLTNCRGTEPVRFYLSDEQRSTFVNGERIKAGVALKESYEDRYSILGMLWKIVFLFLPVMICCSLFKLTYSKYEAMAMYLIAASFIMLIFGMAGYLSVGVILLYLLAAVSIAILLYQIMHLDEEGVKRLVWDAVMPNAGVLLFMTAVVFILDYTSSVRMWDDIWLWGLSPKLMYMFDRMPIHARSTLSFFRYLPIYPVCQSGALFINDRFSETLLYMTKHFLEMGLVFGCIPEMKKKKAALPFFLCFSVIIAEVLFFQPYVFNGLYVDPLLGIALAYMLVKLYVFLNEPYRHNLIRFALSTVYVCVLKDTGWVAVVIIGGLLMLCLLIIREKRKVIAVSLGVGFLSVVITQTAWSTYVTNQYNAYMNPNIDVSVFADTDPENEIETETKTEAETKTDTETKIETEVDNEIDIASYTDTNADIDTDTNVDTVSDVQTQNDNVTETDTEITVGSETITDAEITADTNTTTNEVVPITGRTSIAQTSGISADSVLELLTGQAPAYKYEMIPFHIKKLLIGGDYPTALFAFSFALWCVILLGLYFLLKRKFNYSFSDRVFAILLPGFAFLETVFMQVAFTFAFSEVEAKVFDGEERYLGSVLFSLLVFLIFVSAQNEKALNWKVFLVGLICLMLLTNGAELMRTRIRQRGKKWLTTPEIGREIRTSMTETQNLFYISKSDDGFRHISIAYEITPARLNSMFRGDSKQRNFPVTGEPEGTQYQVSPEELAAEMARYDYLYLEDFDDVFVRSYEEVLINPDTGEELLPNSFYQICRDGERPMYLKRVWTMPPTEEGGS